MAIKPLIASVARYIGNRLIWAGDSITNRYPSDDELRLRVMFGDLTPAEAERRAGHFVCGRYVPDLESQNAIRRAMRIVEVE